MPYWHNNSKGLARDFPVSGKATALPPSRLCPPESGTAKGDNSGKLDKRRRIP
ncbi:MAG: hypothetical protein [Siphoviridae sp. ctpQM7]|nr:MAG: hypothetical protein [Siphoviridae sp. ctpQM7]